MRDPYRLPSTVPPSTYEITLEPDLDAATFQGEVTIDVTAHESTSDITLNAIELDDVTNHEAPNRLRIRG